MESSNSKEFEVKTIYRVKYLSGMLVHSWPASSDGDPGFMAVMVPATDPESQPYTVIIEDNMGMTCDCKGWIYRSNCRHVALVQKTISAKKSQTQ